MSWLKLPGFVSVTFHNGGNWRQSAAATIADIPASVTQLATSCVAGCLQGQRTSHKEFMAGCHDWMVMGWYGDEFMVCLRYI